MIESNLATKRTESEGIKEASTTNLTSVGDPLSRPWLGPLVEEDNLGAIDDVGLYARYVYELLYLTNSHHVMVRGSPYLHPPKSNRISFSFIHSFYMSSDYYYY